MRTVFVTVTDKDGVVLDRVEMNWDSERWPTTKITLVPHDGTRELMPQHPCQSSLILGEDNS